MSQIQIMPTAEPFYLPGGPIGCVLTHGFTGTPMEMRMLGKFLNQQGHTVLAVRLAGHATDLTDMMRMRAEDWLASVEDGYHLLRPHCKKIVLMGLSMGGILSLIQASRLPVDGVVAMSTPCCFPIAWARRNPWIIRLLSPLVHAMEKEPGVWYSPEKEANHVSYPKHPVRSGYELHRLIDLLPECLPEITIPALVIHSKDDRQVPTEDAEQIFNRLGSSQKELIWVDQANHVITRDGNTERVFEPIEAFIQKSIQLREER